MHAALKNALETAKRTRSIIEYRRGTLDVEDGASYGFLVDFSDTWLLTSYIDDRLDLDGYDAVRVADLTDLAVDFARRRFLERCLELKGSRASAPRRICLDDTRALLESVDRSYPLIVVQRERVAPDQCEIGTLKMIADETYALRWMTPEAEWMDDEQLYRLADVTRVAFGCRYETTLAGVAGLVSWPLPS